MKIKVNGEEKKIELDQENALLSTAHSKPKQTLRQAVRGVINESKKVKTNIYQKIKHENDIQIRTDRKRT